MKVRWKDVSFSRAKLKGVQTGVVRVPRQLVHRASSGSSGGVVSDAYSHHYEAECVMPRGSQTFITKVKHA